jgi:hypothetical protein
LVSKLLILAAVLVIVAGGGYLLLAAKPSIAQKMHQVTWTQADLQSWTTKNAQFKDEILQAHNQGIVKEVTLEVTEAEATAIASKTLEDIRNDNSANGIKQQVIQYSKGIVTDASDVQINYLDNQALVSGYVKVSGVNVMVAAQQHTQIVNGRPRKVVDNYQLGSLQIPDQVKEEALKIFGEPNSATFSQGGNNYSAGNLKIVGNSITIDYSIQGVSEYLNLKTVTMNNGKLTIIGTTK